MNQKNRVRLNIAGSEYVILSSEDENYIRSIGLEVDSRMTEIQEGSPCISTTMAAVLAAFDCCDATRKAVSSADHLRAQVKEYLEDAAKARIEADELRRERDRLSREVQTLRARLQNAGKL
ncbi:MAG: cell division protein ZapA [Clostridiales bacterium]|nr:cell division protein ZapA [Clostridiales bacterium]